MSEAIKAFAAELAAETDEGARARLLARVKMLAVQEAPEDAFEPPITTLGDYLDREIEIPPVLVHPKLAVRGGFNITIGRAGKGKTVLNLNRCLKWAAGRPLFDGWTDKDGIEYLSVFEPLKILIVENEGSAGMFHEQVGLMLNAEGYLSKDDRALAKENVLVWGDGGYSGLKLDDPNKLNGLRAGVEKWEPDIVYIEPFRSLWKGDENSSTEMHVVADALVALATDYNCCVWGSHHEKKGGSGDDDKMSAARGSTVLEGVVTTMENFEMTKAGEYREITFSKARYPNTVPPSVSMHWNADARWYDWVPSTQTGNDIVAALSENNDEPMSVAELADYTDYSKVKLRTALKDLEKDAKVKKMPSVSLGPEGSTGPRYRLPSTGAGFDGAAF